MSQNRYIINVTISKIICYMFSNIIWTVWQNHSESHLPCDFGWNTYLLSKMTITKTSNTYHTRQHNEVVPFYRNEKVIVELYNTKFS